MNKQESQKDKYVVLTIYPYDDAVEVRLVTTDKEKAKLSYSTAKDFANESGTFVYFLKAISSSEVLDE